LLKFNVVFEPIDWCGNQQLRLTEPFNKLISEKELLISKMGCKISRGQKLRKGEFFMRKPNTRKVVVYIMLLTMLASTLLMGLSTFL